jgi:putative sigma-54 modulation protein
LAAKTENPMKVAITSRHQPLTEGLRTHIEDKIRRVERYLGKIKEAHVVLTFERKKIHQCEVNLTAKSLKLSARASSHDMYTSIDAAMDRLEKQAHKQKDKWTEHHAVDNRRPSSRKPAASREGEGIQVIRAAKQAVKPMSVEEAALQLSSSKDEFLVFLNAETEKTSVVYKRSDHHIGLIEPEY